jgi:hypothetical protein
MADLDPGEHTVDELRDELDGMDDPEALEELRKVEADGENRGGAKGAIDERLDAVTGEQRAAADGDGGASAGIVEVRNRRWCRNLHTP